MESDGLASSGKSGTGDSLRGDASAEAQRAIARAVEHGCVGVERAPTNVDIVKTTAPAQPPASVNVQTTQIVSRPAEAAPIGAQLAAPLSSRKLIAASAMARRKTIAEAAKLANVDSTTLRRWMRNDPQFKAAVNAWAIETAEATRVRTLAMAHGAMENVENAVDAGSLQASLFVLRRIAEEQKQPLQITPDAVAEQMRLEACKLQLEIDRKREELWKLELEIKIDRSERQRKVKPYGYKPDGPKINGLDPLDLPVELKPEDDPTTEGS